MKTNDNMSQFKPSTYCDNVSEPLLERIKELEHEISTLRKQIRTLKYELAFKQQSPASDAMPQVRFQDQNRNQKEVEPV